jgi:hypothetical protein
MKRYQYSSKCVKIYRWFKYRPYYLVRAWISVISWCCAGMVIPVEEREYFKYPDDYIQHIFTCWRSVAEMKMEHYWTLDEVIKDLTP